jgi:hypothetical protein
LRHRLPGAVYACDNGFVVCFAGLSRRVSSSTCQTELWVTPSLFDHTILHDPDYWLGLLLENTLWIDLLAMEGQLDLPYHWHLDVLISLM